MKHFIFSLLLSTVAAGTTFAEEQDGEDFVTSNLIATFYHELAHALIDIEEIPIFGQEEDAADVFSIIAIDQFYEEDAARDITIESALGYLGEATLRGDEEIAFWGVHGIDEQRYYNLVCIFVGGNMETRSDLAEELDLPEDRLDTCEEEYEQALNAWGGVLDDLAEPEQGVAMVYDGDPEDSLTSSLISEEVAWLNTQFNLSDALTVQTESCGEPNAFYDPSEQLIIMCEEYEDHLFELSELEL